MMYPLEEAKQEIILICKEAFDKLGYKIEIKLENPPEDLGDFALPCYSLAPIAKKSPEKIAQEISVLLKPKKWIRKIQSKGAYVNFYIHTNEIVKKTMKLVKKLDKKYGQLKKLNKKVIVEHTSANPNGPLHVGRARNPIIGDTLARIYKTAGYNVETQFYLDDMGKQVAILAWGIDNVSKEKIPKSLFEKPDHKLVGYYQEASKLSEENPKIAKEIGKIVKKSEEGDKKTIDLVHKAYTPVLEGMKESLKNINIEIDNYVPESKFVADKSVNFVIDKLKESKYSESENGAFYLDMKEFGVQGRNTNFFYLRKDGTSLYATRDIAYHIWKAKKADILINVLGEDHKLESKQVEIALNIIGIENVPTPIFYSFVSMPGGKMSTRKGRVVFVDDLIEECISRAYYEVKKRRGKELNHDQMVEIAKIIGIGALRYNIIKVQPEKGIEFQWEEALNFEGNSSPFIQYAHARACSILSKNTEPINDFNPKKLNHEAEIKLIKKLAYYPFIVSEASESFKPHLIANYLYEVASLFNQFYRDCPVLPEKNNDIRIARLALVDSTRIVLRNALDVLGITAPEEM